MLKLYVYGHLNRAPSSRQLEREAERNVELMWLTGKWLQLLFSVETFRKESYHNIG